MPEDLPAEHEALLPLIRACTALGAERAGGPLSSAERALIRAAERVPPPAAREVRRLADAIREGGDPLGDAYCRLAPAAARRRMGAFYTPLPVVGEMVRWVLAQGAERVVDAGCGSGRFAACAVRLRPGIRVVAVDLDPAATLMTRAALAVLGAESAAVLQADYLTCRLPPLHGRTGFLSNPPYVRHHALSAHIKRRGRELAHAASLPVSGLSGLHVYFWLATRLHIRPGDVGCFITSAEWLDAAYGEALRRLLAQQLPCVSLHLFAAEEQVFPDAMTSAVVTCFRTEPSPRVLLQKVADIRRGLDLENPAGAVVVERKALCAPRWRPLFDGRGDEEPLSPEAIRLGDLFRISRGIATGANTFFVLDAARGEALGLSPFLVPVVSRAADVLKGGGVIEPARLPGRLLCLPESLSGDDPAMSAARRYVAMGESRGYPSRRLCAARKPWWRIAPGAAPPIVVTYMARQPPVFALNPHGVPILNIALGLYPKAPLSLEEMTALVAYLNRHRAHLAGAGRIYQGGLVKFEPRDLARIPVPHPAALRRAAEEQAPERCTDPSDPVRAEKMRPEAGHAAGQDGREAQRIG